MRELSKVYRVQGILEQYFADCKEKHLKMTVSRLCVYLNVSKAALSRFVFSDNINEDEKESDVNRSREILAAALRRCECWLEDGLFAAKTFQGAKFALSNNFGWSDKIQTKQDNDTTVTISWATESALNQGIDGNSNKPTKQLSSNNIDNTIKALPVSDVLKDLM